MNITPISPAAPDVCPVTISGELVGVVPNLDEGICELHVVHETDRGCRDFFVTCSNEILDAPLQLGAHTLIAARAYSLPMVSGPLAELEIRVRYVGRHVDQAL